MGKLNYDTFVKVKLTKTGADLVNAKNETLNEIIDDDNKTDYKENDLLECRLWWVFQTLGPHCSILKDKPFYYIRDYNEINKSEKYLVQYARDVKIKVINPIKYERVKGKIYGVVVATKDGVGWSLCNKQDVFDKKIGTAIALERIGKNTSYIPKKMRYFVDIMEKRRKKYFK